VARPARAARPVHGALTGLGRKPRLDVIDPAPWELWRWTREAHRAIRWIESVARVPTGHNAGDLMRLAPFQRSIVHDVYDNLAAFESIATANGKTTLLGAIALERISRGDDYAEVDVIATKLDQASEVVRAAARIAEASPDLRARCALYDEDTELRYRPTGSRLRAQPARLKAVEGLNFNLGIVDEVGFADDDLIESLVARLGKRADAHLLGMGTPGFTPNLLWRIRQQFHAGDLPAHVVYREFAGPEGCDLHDRDAWTSANPAIAAGFLRPQALELQVSMLPESKFRVYHLGQWVDQASAWLPAGAWESCPDAAPPIDGTDVVIAVEGTYQRTVAVCGATLDGAVFHCWSSDRATDAELRTVLDVASERWNVIEVSHNRRVRTRLFRDLEIDGAPVNPWNARNDVEAESANELYRAILDQTIVHDHDELLTDHVSRLRARLFSDGSLRLVRPEGESVDAALAMRNAWWRASELAETQPATPIRIY